MAVVLGDRHEAEDAAQRVFLDVWRALPGYQERGRLRPWLFRIVRNRGLKERARVHRRDVPRGDAIVALREAQGHHPDAGSWLSEPSVATELVQRLPPRSRQIVLMRFVFGMSVADCAGELDMTSAALQQAQSRALALLQGRLVALQNGARAVPPARAAMMARGWSERRPVGWGFALRPLPRAAHALASRSFR
jgi:RNA polymerase sigma-70 factor (ECF subfamily)